MSDQRQEPWAEADPTSAARELGGLEAYQLKRQVQSGDFSGMRQYLARTRHARDWQDRFFMLGLVAPEVQIETLTAASGAEPDAADLHLLLGGYYCEMIGKSRGAAVAEQTSEEQFDGAQRQLQKMMDCVQRACRSDADDPLPHVVAMRGLVVFNNYENALKKEFAEAIRLASDCLPAHYYAVNARSKKWGGSHEESLYLARAAMKSADVGSDMAGCLFLAHFLVWQYAAVFDKNKTAADLYLENRSVSQELNQELDRWMVGGYQARRASIPYLHQAALWYYLSGDNVRLNQVLTSTAGVPCDYLWKQLGNADKRYNDALQKAASVRAKKPGFLGWFSR